jgi:hypothetical protein
MDQKTKIILGIALLGGAYYLYTRKKPEAVGAVNQIPKSYDNTSNCENQFKDYERNQNMMKVVREPKTPEQYQAYKQNWIKNNCKLKM